VPVGRLLAEDLQDLANICENFGDKEIRLTEDQNIIITGIDTNLIEEFKGQSILQKFQLEPETLQQVLFLVLEIPIVVSL